MPISDKGDEKVVRLIKKEAEKYNAKINKIDLEKQILDIECPEENKQECAVAIEKLLEKMLAK